MAGDTLLYPRFAGGFAGRIIQVGDNFLDLLPGSRGNISAVVLKWSRARKRYERQGLLVEESALQRAEQECLADEDVRARRRERETERRAELDQGYVLSFAKRVRELFPCCPAGANRSLPNMPARNTVDGWGGRREPKVWTRNLSCLWSLPISVMPRRITMNCYRGVWSVRWREIRFGRMWNGLLRIGRRMIFDTAKDFTSASGCLSGGGNRDIQPCSKYKLKIAPSVILTGQRTT